MRLTCAGRGRVDLLQREPGALRSPARTRAAGRAPAPSRALPNPFFHPCLSRRTGHSSSAIRQFSFGFFFSPLLAWLHVSSQLPYMTP